MIGPLSVAIHDGPPDVTSICEKEWESERDRKNLREMWHIGVTHAYTHIELTHFFFSFFFWLNSSGCRSLSV